MKINDDLHHVEFDISIVALLIPIPTERHKGGGEGARGWWIRREWEIEGEGMAT